MMKLSDCKIDDSVLLTDGEFDILAQCVVQSEKKVLTFLEDIKYLDVINNNSSISCVICPESYVGLLQNKSLGIIISEKPRIGFFKLHNELVEIYKGQDIKTQVGEKSKISPTANIAPLNVIIGKNVIIEDYVTIHENTIIGDNSCIRSGSTIGGQGFEFKKDQQSIITVKHIGSTIIGNNVEIKELCTVHCALFHWDKTVIDDYCKIDAHTHIGHATKLGKRVLVGSHANIAGNVIIFDDVYIGPGTTISNRVKIGSGAKINIGSVVVKDVKENGIVTGNFAIEHHVFIQDLKHKIKKYKANNDC